MLLNCFPAAEQDPLFAAVVAALDAPATGRFAVTRDVAVKVLLVFAKGLLEGSEAGGRDGVAADGYDGGVERKGSSVDVDMDEELDADKRRQ